MKAEGFFSISKSAVVLRGRQWDPLQHATFLHAALIKSKSGSSSVFIFGKNLLPNHSIPSPKEGALSELLNKCVVSCRNLMLLPCVCVCAIRWPGPLHAPPAARHPAHHHQPAVPEAESDRLGLQPARVLLPQELLVAPWVLPVLHTRTGREASAGVQGL